MEVTGWLVDYNNYYTARTEGLKVYLINDANPYRPRGVLIFLILIMLRIMIIKQKLVMILTQ